MKDENVTSGQFNIKYLLLVAALVMLFSSTLMLRYESAIVHAPITEDGYYDLTVSRNIALGKGLTIDGVHKTNGIQPLWVILLAPVYWLTDGDHYSSLRYVLFAHWLFYLATGYVLCLVGRDIFPPGDKCRKPMALFSLLIFLCSSYAFINHFNGLETGCMLFLYCCAWRYYQTHLLNTVPQALVFGGILGLAVLARIDCVFLVLYVVLLDIIYHRFLWNRIRLMLTVAGTAFLVSLPWWLYNCIYFGSLMPTSGSAQQEFTVSWERIAFAIVQLLKICIPFGSQGIMEIITNLSFAETVNRLIIVGTIILLLVHYLKKTFAHRSHTEQYNTLKRTKLFSCAILVSTLTLVAWYTLSSFAWYFYGRYFSPALLPAVLCLSFITIQYMTRETLGRRDVQLGIILFCAMLFFVKGLLISPNENSTFFTLLNKILSFTLQGASIIAIVYTVIRPQDPTSFFNRHGRLKLRACILSIGLASMLFLSFMNLVFACWNVNVSSGWGKSIFYTEQLALINRYVPRGEKVAAFQSGTLGYFRENVVNLDGKVNAKALMYKNDIHSYLIDSDIYWFCDWHPTAVKHLGDPPSENGWGYVDKKGRPHLDPFAFELYHYRSQEGDALNLTSR